MILFPVFGKEVMTCGLYAINAQEKVFYSLEHSLGLFVTIAKERARRGFQIVIIQGYPTIFAYNVVTYQIKSLSVIQ
jgi:hypothetical protein